LCVRSPPLTSSPSAMTPPLEPSRTAPGPREAAAEIVRSLRENGHVAYFAGGCVRDELLGLAPEDYDVATDAPPVRITSLFKRTSVVGAAFGVVLVRLGASTVEVATFRTEGVYTDKRRPDSVQFSDAPTDARRRDFTINALFLDPLDTTTAPQSPRGGHIIDHVGGTADLARRVLRAVGDPDQRLAEDHLRALRAVRLTARLSFTLDPGTGAAITRHARDLSGVSRERIGDELRKMLAAASRVRALRMLHDLGLDGPVLTEPSHPWVSGILDRLGEAALPVPTALAAWALDRGSTPDAPGGGAVSRAWRRALCLSNDETESLKQVIAGVGVLEREWSGLGLARRKRAAAAAWFGLSIRLVLARNAELGMRIEDDLRTLSVTPSGISPPPLLTGDDLICEGLPPGPAFKSVLDRVYDAQLEDRVRTPTEARALALSLAAESGLDRPK